MMVVMVREPILYVDVSDIRPGMVSALKALIGDLVAFVDANEPQLIAYEFFVDEAEQTMTCVALHPDSASLERHMDVGWERFQHFVEHIDQRSIDVYGPVSESVIARLHRKIEMLGRGRVAIHRRTSGFTRLDVSAAPDLDEHHLGRRSESDRSTST